MRHYLIITTLSLAFIGLILFSSNKVTSFNLISSEDSIPTPIYDLWAHWKTQHTRNYGYAEEKFRAKVFYENYKFVSEFENNYPDATYSVELNKFADLTNLEFQRFNLGLDITFKDNGRNERFLASELQASVDWRTKNAVSKVKDQGQCGSCWAFSSTGALESLNKIRNGVMKLFSEQQLVDCSSSYGNLGCNGGLMDNAFKYTQKYGIETESDYGYTAKDGSCKYDAKKVAFKNSGYVDVPSRNLDQLAAAVGLQPVSVAVDATSWQFYSGGILSKNCGTSLNHGVLLVGYGTEGTTDYWIVKNSWGTSWGEQGYIRLQKTSGKGTGECGIALQASYPTLSP